MRRRRGHIQMTAHPHDEALGHEATAEELAHRTAKLVPRIDLLERAFLIGESVLDPKESEEMSKYNHRALQWVVRTTQARHEREATLDRQHNDTRDHLVTAVVNAARSQVVDAINARKQLLRLGMVLPIWIYQLLYNIRWLTRLSCACAWTGPTFVQRVDCPFGAILHSMRVDRHMLAVTDQSIFGMPHHLHLSDSTVLDFYSVLPLSRQFIVITATTAAISLRC